MNNISFFKYIIVLFTSILDNFILFFSENNWEKLTIFHSISLGELKYIWNNIYIIDGLDISYISYFIIYIIVTVVLNYISININYNHIISNI